MALRVIFPRRCSEVLAQPRGLRVFFVPFDVPVHRGLQFGNRREACLCQALAGDDPEGDLHHVQARTALRGEVLTHPQASYQPVRHVLVPMRGIVIADYVRGNFSVLLADPEVLAQDPESAGGRCQAQHREDESAIQALGKHVRGTDEFR